MSGESPVVNIFSSDGYESAVVNGVPIQANTRGYLSAGTDGTNARIILMDGSSRQIVAGAGVAGTPAGGIITIQGIFDGYAVLVSGQYNSAGITLTDTQQASLQLTSTGLLKTSETAAPSTTTNVTTVAASASNVTLLASNSNRIGATVWNESTTATLYLKMGSTASLTSYTAQLFPSGYFEVPYNYTGEIDGIWSAAIGNARITEVTP